MLYVRRINYLNHFHTHPNHLIFRKSISFESFIVFSFFLPIFWLLTRNLSNLNQEL